MIIPPRALQRSARQRAITVQAPPSRLPTVGSRGMAHRVTSACARGGRCPYAAELLTEIGGLVRQLVRRIEIHPAEARGQVEIKLIGNLTALLAGAQGAAIIGGPGTRAVRAASRLSLMVIAAA
ncbi:MAG: hypothetical protein HYR63_24470 [Proteobacteria bacterium]|nr:hypothetical protein [Pseudomonadota bacterium]